MSYETRDFEVIVIDPDGLGKGKPSVGLGFRMAEKYMGINEPNLSRWLVDEGDTLRGLQLLKLPSGNAFEVIRISGTDGQDYVVVEASNWMDIATDLLVHPGRLGKATKEKLAQFVRWFAVKGFYAEAYANLKGTYNKSDDRALTEWLQARVAGISARKKYTDTLQKAGAKPTDYGKWTDIVYYGLFGFPASRIKQQWDVVSGVDLVARNHIPKSMHLKAIAECEGLVSMLYYPGRDLWDTHQQAIDVILHRYGG
ncbi:hypothetical protein [Chroococcidiopsis thermalis]|nr:hypothetical protein [Chroococcidiopsis thermalis]